MALKKWLQQVVFISTMIAFLINPLTQAHAMLIDVDEANLTNSTSEKKMDSFLADKGKHKGDDKDESEDDKDHGTGNDDKEEKTKKGKKGKKGKKK